MKQLPETNHSPVLRTDFSDQAAWDAICDVIRRPSPEGFEAYVEFIDDRAFAGLEGQGLLAAVPAGYVHTFVIVVDRKAVSDVEQPVLVVNLFGELGAEVGATFRVPASEIHAVENNLSISNMDFVDFAEAVDQDGVFRGF